MQSRRPRQSGQSMVEFALVGLLFFVVILAILDFGFLYSGKVSATDAIRASARYAAVNPQAWDNAANPAGASIQGQLKLTAVPAVVVNDDAHVTIRYLIPGTGATGIVCGHYKASDPGHGYVPENALDPNDTLANCVVGGHLVSVQATYNYQWITPMLHAIFPNQTLTGQATEYIEG